MKKKFLFVFSIILFRILLDWIYKVEIAPFFEYANYFDYSTNISTIYSWCFLLLFIPFVLWIVDSRYNLFSQFIALFFLFLKIIPLSSEIRFIPQSSLFVCANFVYWFIILLLLMYLKPQNPFGLFKDSHRSHAVILLISILSASTVVYVSGVYCHFRINLNLADAYEFRYEAREFNMPIVLKYLLAATPNLIPILIVYYIMHGKRTIPFLLVFIGLLNFSVAGQKSTLFKIILCVGLFLFPKINFKKYIPYLFVVLCVIAITEFLWMNTTALSYIVIRRGFYVPASLDVAYYDYILKHGPTYFTEGIASKIGWIYGNEEKRCNNGMFSDAFMNLGYIGCIIFPLIIAYYVKIMEFMTLKLNNSLKVYSAFLIVSTLVSSYFTTSMLTHGLFLLGVTLFFIPNPTNLNKNSSKRSCNKILIQQE